jgi:hypothetical protein
MPLLAFWDCSPNPFTPFQTRCKIVPFTFGRGSVAGLHMFVVRSELVVLLLLESSPAFHRYLVVSETRGLYLWSLSTTPKPPSPTMKLMLTSTLTYLGNSWQDPPSALS